MAALIVLKTRIDGLCLVWGEARDDYEVAICIRSALSLSIALSPLLLAMG